jgi:4a-hydroxytetrahydrobiopterin dehydratase
VLQHEGAFVFRLSQVDRRPRALSSFETASSAISRLTAAERAAALRALPLWRYEAAAGAAPEGLRRGLRFRDFAACWAFMSRVALLAERAQHHPEWSNVYGALDVRLSTHDAGGLSRRDVALAEQIDAAAEAHKGDLLA